MLSPSASHSIWSSLTVTGLADPGRGLVRPGVGLSPPCGVRIPYRALEAGHLEGWWTMKAGSDDAVSDFCGALTRSRMGRSVVQDFRPVAESLEWQLGQHYFAKMGSKSFIAGPDPVPYAVNNDGNLSSKAAELVFASLEASELQGPLEETVFVLELGIGVGLFARLFMDRFRDLCIRKGADYYDRLCYVAGDRSEKMLLDACRHGTFADHPGRYLLRVIDANEPFVRLTQDLAHTAGCAPRFRAVLLNYVLDCLPATVLQINEHDVRELCIKTYLARSVELSDHTTLAIDEIADLADKGGVRCLAELSPLYGLFASEYAYRRFNPGPVPFAQCALAHVRGQARYFVHNHGAMQCLSRLHESLADDGFILINDYGHSNLEEAEEGLEPQRFSGSCAVGLNLSVIRECLKESGITDWVEPTDDHGHLLSRLVLASASSSLATCFREVFGKKASEAAQKPIADARAHCERGRDELAASFYEQALRDQPWNWALMAEVARFLTFNLRDPHAGLALNRAALALNPCCSSDLWSDLGDSLHLLNRAEEARRAFHRALRINLEDPRAYYSLANSYICEKDVPSALRAIGEGMAVDRSGSRAKAFIKLQNDALELLNRRMQLEARLQVDRISRVLDQM
jgi:tetratricopeptide (TPR) repeat protein